YMGQQLLNPPSVEGWHQGLEWIETGSITERVNFCVQQMSDLSNPGILKIIKFILNSDIQNISTSDIIDKILNEIGGLDISQNTRESLEDFINNIDLSKSSLADESTIANVFGVIGSVPEFQRC
ncbi:MAG: DUF1800 family protein, partial [Dehalococcoidia bacterium]